MNFHFAKTTSNIYPPFKGVGLPTMLVAVGLVVSLCLSSAIVAAPTDEFRTSWDDPRVVFEGEVSFTDTEVPPGSDAAWQAVELPDLWTSRTDMQEDRAWYRFVLERNDAPNEIYAVYLWRYSLNARIYFNNDLLVDGGSFEEPVARNLHRPILASIPQSAWRSDGNFVYVHLRGYPRYGHLLPIGIGPYSAFEAAYEERLFFQVELSQYLFIITLLVALIAAGIWSVDWKNSAYGYFAAACLVWSMYSLNPFIQNLPFSNLIWLRTLHTSIDLFGYLLMMFVHRQLGHKNPKLEMAVLGCVIAAGIFYSTLPIQSITRTTSLVHLLTNGVGVYLLFFSIRNYVITRNPESLLYALMLLILIGVSLHDVLLISGAAVDLWVTNFLAFNLGAPFVFVVLTIYMTWRVGRENMYWESRIKAVTGQLEGEFETRESLEREKAAADERERIYRDLHDDIGSRLLSMIYRAESPQQAEQAREALRDMRAMVATSNQQNPSLDEVVADWHQEVGRRLEEAGVALSWEQTELTDEISAEVAYQLTRVLRELISNIIKHAQAHAVVCTFTIEESTLRMKIVDDGKGLAQPFEAKGSGVAGIRYRVDQLGGTVAWQSLNPGTTVMVGYPLK